MAVRMSIHDEIGEWEPELIATRRDLHMHPEIGLEEFRTSGIVAERLAEEYDLHVAHLTPKQ